MLILYVVHGIYYALARASLSFIRCSGVVFIFYETPSVQMSADMQGKIGYG